jgi:gas vesicle protein
MAMRRDRIPGTILTFALGAGIGAVVALLLAPKSGEELRGDIADGVNDGVNQVRSSGRDLKRRAQKVMDLAKDQVQDAIDAGDRAYSQAKNA